MYHLIWSHVVMCFVCVLVVQSFPMLWTEACQAPLLMEFSRQEYWSGLLFPSLGVLPNPEINPSLLHWDQILYHLSYMGSPSGLVVEPFSLHLEQLDRFII